MPQTLRAPTKGRVKREFRKVFIPGEKLLDSAWISQEDLYVARQLISTKQAALTIRLATADDLGTILDLIGEAKNWLKTRKTDQWSIDWPDKDGRRRSDRVECSLKEYKTWIVFFDFRGQKIPVATVTIESTANTDIWTDEARIAERAVYLSRLVTTRKFSGLHIGNALIDWACEHAAREYDAQWIRIDVWTTNKALHRYYKKRKFKFCSYCPDETYPSRALFQRSTSRRCRRKPLLREYDDFAAAGDL